MVAEACVYPAERSPLDQFVPDPAGIEPLCGKEEFAELLAGMVADNVPKIFAIVHEYGDRVDACCAGWGLYFDDRAYVVSSDGQLRCSARNPEDILHVFGFGTHVKPRLVWVG
jgi:hypothetical protein